MSLTNIKCFIFGALTHQIPFLFFKHIFIDDKADLLKENNIHRKSIPCLQVSREKRSDELEAVEELEVGPVFQHLENFSESTLNRSRVDLSPKHAYNPRNKTNWNYFYQPFLETKECSCDQNETLFPSFNFNNMFDERKHAEYETENLIRKQQYKNHLQNNRFTEMAHPLITRSPFNFIEVPTFGVTLQPAESVIFPIKFHLTEKEIIKVELHCQFGSFSQAIGIEWREVAETNMMMQKIRYSVKVYDARPVTDIVTVTVVRKLTKESLKAQFPGSESLNSSF
jgi:hypothetical protein